MQLHCFLEHLYYVRIQFQICPLQSPYLNPLVLGLPHTPTIHLKGNGMYCITDFSVIYKYLAKIQRLHLTRYLHEFDFGDRGTAWPTSTSTPTYPHAGSSTKS